MYIIEQFLTKIYVKSFCMHLLDWQQILPQKILLNLNFYDGIGTLIIFL